METQNNQNNNHTEQSDKILEKPMDSASKIHDQAHTHKMLFGILSYIGILVLVPLIMKKDDPFVKFHIKQGLVVFVITLIIWILSGVLGGYGSFFWMIYKILNLGVLVLSIIGIVNVVQNKTTELPLVGHLARHFPI